MSSKHVLLERFSHVHEAEMARSFLDSRGIASELRDQHLVNMDWLYSNVIGGVRLMVAEEDFAEARKTLDEINGPRLVEDDEGLGAECPKCQSTKSEIIENHKGKALLLLYLTQFLVLPFLAKEKWKCRDCQNEWDEKRRTPLAAYLIPFFVIMMIYFGFQFVLQALRNSF